jgi:hypothetical protein
MMNPPQVFACGLAILIAGLPGTLGSTIASGRDQQSTGEWDATAKSHPEVWAMHFIHEGPIGRKGADGTDFEDVNSDGYPDVVAAWQHGLRAYV